MSQIEAVVKTVKESSGYIAMSTGAGMTQASINIIQVLGVIIGVGGLVVAVLRWMEAKRANDLDEEKWRYERAKSNDDEKT